MNKSRPTATQRTTPASATVTSEPQPGLPSKFSQWLRRNAWLLIGGFIALTWVQSNADHAETPAMGRNRATIEKMSRTERDLVRHNEQLYHDLTPALRREVRTMHNAIEADPELQQTLAQWHEWLATLSFNAREKVLSTTDPQERLALVRHLRQPGPPSAQDLLIRKFPQLANLKTVPQRFADEYFQTVIRVTARYLEMPEASSNSTPEKLFAYNASVVRRLLERLRQDSIRSGELPQRPAQRFAMPQALREQLSNEFGGHAERMFPPQGTTTGVMIFIVGLYGEASRLVRELRPSDDEWYEIHRRVERQLSTDRDGRSREEMLETLSFEWLKSRVPNVVAAADFLESTLVRMRGFRSDARARTALDERPEQ